MSVQFSFTRLLVESTSLLYHSTSRSGVGDICVDVVVRLVPRMYTQCSQYHMLGYHYTDYEYFFLRGKPGACG